MEMTLEQEFTARVFMHKTAIVGGVLMKEYIDNELYKNGIPLPKFIIEKNADEYSNKKMQECIANGTFDTLYNRIWDKLSQEIPENFKVI